MTGVLHALCNAHHLRELKALVEIENEDWARRMQRLLRRACHASNLARERGVPLKPGLIALFERWYDTILADGLAFHDTQPALVRAGGTGKRRGRPPRRAGKWGKSPGTQVQHTVANGTRATEFRHFLASDCGTI